MFNFSKLLCYLALTGFLPQIVHSFFEFSDEEREFNLEYTSSDVLEDARLDTVSAVAPSFLMT